MSVSFGRTRQDSLPSAAGVGQDSPRFSAGPPEVCMAPEREKAVDLLIAVRGPAGEVNRKSARSVLDFRSLGPKREPGAGG